MKRRCALVLLLVSTALQAAQTFEVKDGDTINITVSRKEVTRISVSGAGRIATVRGAEGVVQVTPDKEVGDIYLRPLTPSGDFSFFVRDSFGNNYTLAARQADVPSQTVLLKPAQATAPVDNVQAQRYKDIPLKTRIAELMKAMATQGELTGFDRVVQEKPVEIQRWKEVTFRLKETWSGYELTGEVFTLTNITRKTLTFHEREFLDVGQGVMATAMDKLQLAPNETSRVYVVRSHGR